MQPNGAKSWFLRRICFQDSQSRQLVCVRSTCSWRKCDRWKLHRQSVLWWRWVDHSEAMNLENFRGKVRYLQVNAIDGILKVRSYSWRIRWRRFQCFCRWILERELLLWPNPCLRKRGRFLRLRNWMNKIILDIDKVNELSVKNWGNFFHWISFLFVSVVS